MDAPAPPPAIIIPIQPHDTQVVLPPAPQDLTTPQDCTAEDSYHSTMYEHRIVSQAAAVAPPEVTGAPAWLQEAINGLRNEIRQMRFGLQSEINEIQQKCNGLQIQIRHVRDVQIEDIRVDLRTMVIPRLNKLTNLCDEGAMPLELILFDNGDDPTIAPYNLPPLDSAEAIMGLNEQNLNAYLEGYCIHPPPLALGVDDISHWKRDELKRKVGAQRVA